MEKIMDSKSQIPNPNEIPKPNSQPGSGSKGKPYDLRDRTMEFAIRILTIAAAIPKEAGGPIIVDQISRSGASVGANVEEADGAVTRADKRKSFIVSRKEVRETRYWLRIIDRVWGRKIAVRQDIAEATEPLYILSAITDKLA
jgi:four helix bundle protein